MAEVDDWEKEWDEEKLVEKIEELKIDLSKQTVENEKKENPTEKKVVRAVKGRGAFKFENEQKDLAQDELNDTPKQSPSRVDNIQKSSPSKDNNSPRKTSTQVARRMIANALQIPELQKSKTPDEERLQKKKEPKKNYWDE